MTERIDCAILGATGAVGQRFVERLADHPTFRISALVGHGNKVGRRYGDVADWCLERDVPANIADQTIIGLDDLPMDGSVRVVFSALPGGIAGPIETRLADAGLAVFSNARDHRMDLDVPLLIPEVNPQDANMVAGKSGFIVANGNCSGIILTLALAPLHQRFGITSVDVTTMQARSGAGHPAKVDLDTHQNVLPSIGGEEDKLRTEPLKVLAADFPIHPTCTRVDVPDGHFESVHVRLLQPASAADVADAFASFRGPDDLHGLPSAPARPIHVLAGDDVPQPKHHLDLEGGMAVGVGRIRVDEDHVRFIVLGHNTVRGAAGQSVLNAEYLHAQGLLLPAKAATA